MIGWRNLRAVPTCNPEDRCPAAVEPRGHAVDQGRALSSGQAVEVKMELLTGKVARRVRIEASIAWAKGDYVGVPFTRTSGVIVNALHGRAGRPGKFRRP